MPNAPGDAARPDEGGEPPRGETPPEGGASDPRATIEDSSSRAATVGPAPRAPEQVPSPSRAHSAARAAQSQASRQKWMALWPAGRRIGPYEVVRPLGRGAMGVVLVAKQVELAREVALKVLPGFADEDAVERFRREAEAIARLDHPSIVRVFDRGVAEEGLNYYAMELVRGSSLDLLIKRERPSYVEAARLMAQVAFAIDYAHGQGVIHRDVKPANILVDERGRARVTDFGLARMDHKASLTEEGTVVGTPLYLPPEVARGERATRAADIYSIGATLYELATGRPPYDGREAKTILTKILVEAPRPPSEIDARVPRDLVQVISKAMMREPSQRYANARSLGLDLERFASERPLEIAGRAGGAWKESAFSRTVKRGALVLGTAGAVVLGTLWVVRAEYERRKARAEAKAKSDELEKLKREGARPAAPSGPKASEAEAVRAAKDRDIAARIEISKLPPDGAKAEAEPALARARAALAERRRGEALAFAREALAVLPHDPGAHLEHARALLLQEDGEAAERELTIALELPGGTPEVRAAARLERARIYRARGGDAWRFLGNADLRVAWGVQGWPGRLGAGAWLALALAQDGEATAARKLLLDLGEAQGDDLAVARLAEAYVLRAEKAPREQLEDALDRARQAARSDETRRAIEDVARE